MVTLNDEMESPNATVVAQLHHFLLAVAPTPSTFERQDRSFSPVERAFPCAVAETDRQREGGGEGDRESHVQPCMTEIYLHIDARMADYIRTHPYSAVPQLWCHFNGFSLENDD